MNAEFIVAVHALIYLYHKNGNVQSEELARNVCTNPARIRKIMSKLKKKGLIEAHGSGSGGYRFIKDPESITLLDIFEATAGSIIKVTWRSGKNCECPISRKMAPVMDGVFSRVENAARSSLGEINLSEINRSIFDGEKTPEDFKCGC